MATGASVKNVSLSPNPPKRGQLFKVTSKLHVSEEVATGEIIIEIWDEGERIVHQKMRLCYYTNAKGSLVPLQKGRYAPL